MATHESIQDALGKHLKGIRILKSHFISATAEDVYCEGGTEAPGRTRWVRINPSQSAAQQAAAIRAAMLA